MKLPLISMLVTGLLSPTINANAIDDAIKDMKLSSATYHQTSYNDLYYIQGLDRDQRTPVTIFSSPDGGTIYTGDIVRKQEGRFVSLAAEAKLSELRKLEPITFKAKNEVGEIYVFTDYTCSYCLAFHELFLPLLNERGVTVNYVAFPREGLVTKEAYQLSLAWCSENPKAALNELKAGGELSTPDNSIKQCNKDIVQHYTAARAYGFNGTPAFVSADGDGFEGFPQTEAGTIVQTFEDLASWLEREMNIRVRN